MIDINDEIEREEQKQALSIPAQRLREKLLPLKSKEEQTARRWFWELLQNASDYNTSVNVRLEVNDNQVVFKHDGNPFSIQDVLNLISPDTGKERDEIKKENIGKFGSGLVSTHILSAIIEVDGIFKSKDGAGLHEFKVLLDRSSYENKDALIQGIEATKKSFKQSHAAVKNPAVGGFMTSFRYDLKKRLPGLSAGYDVIGFGLEHVYDVLPYTLCFMPKVLSVEISDKREKAGISTYLIKRGKSDDNSESFEISSNGIDTKIDFIKLRHLQVETVYRQENGAVIPLPKNIAKLFCGLPMVGSENAGLPFLINSFDFNPTTEREGVEITPGDEHNRKLLDQAITLYQKVLEDIARRKLDGAFELTKLSAKYQGVEGSKNIFRRDYVPRFKNVIARSKIVKNALGQFIEFSESLLPYKEGKPHLELYHLALEVKSNRLPAKSSYEGWAAATDFGIFPEQKYELKQFVTEVSKTGQTQAFVLQSQRPAVAWLRDIASLVSEEDELLFIQIPILPNQKGTLQLKTELSVDKEIPSALKTIHNSLHDEELEVLLLDKAFNDFESLIAKSTDAADVCRRIDNSLKEKYAADKASTASFLQPLNELYRWIGNCKYSKKELESLFTWFYPRRATLFMDTFGDNERDYAFTIVQSGKIKALASLAESEITEEELEYIGNNPDLVSKFYAFMQSEVNDTVNANSETGDFGEKLVYDDLRKKYKQTDGYEVIWASKKGEPRYDFEVRLKSKPVFYVDAKTTTRGLANSDSIPFFMRHSQWEFLPEVSVDAKYVVARVFKTDELIRYLHIDLLS